MEPATSRPAGVVCGLFFLLTAKQICAIERRSDRCDTFVSHTNVQSRPRREFVYVAPMNCTTEHATDICLRSGKEPTLASHLVTPRTPYSRHGIQGGAGRIIQCSGLAHGVRGGAVADVSLGRFARSYDIRVRCD